MNIQLSDHFNYRRLIRFVLPSIGMMIFTSIYGVVDGLFVSNYVGKTPFAALNLIYPFIMVLGAAGFMLGTGGSAYVGKTLGEGKRKEANQYFSFLVYTAIVLGVVLAVLGILFARPAAILLGADESMADYCVIYARIILAALPAFMLQNLFQSFMITAEKPQLGLAVTVAAGVTNMFLDWLFVAVFSWGLSGAAFATALSQCVGGIVPLVYFICQSSDETDKGSSSNAKNTCALQLVKTGFYKDVLWKSCSNGISELLSNISMSIVSMLYNFQLMRVAGENGIAAYGVIMYVQFVFVAMFIGYSIGTAPIISFHYGAGNRDELKNLFQKSSVIVTISGVVLTSAALLLAGTLSKLFVGYDAKLYDMTVRGFQLCAVSFMFCGFGIFGSSLFTALNNGIVSAVISFLRSVVFQVAAVLVLPIILGIDGIWASVSLAEFAGMVITFIFIFKMKNKYHYM